MTAVASKQCGDAGHSRQLRHEISRCQVRARVKVPFYSTIFLGHNPELGSSLRTGGTLPTSSPPKETWRNCSCDRKNVGVCERRRYDSRNGNVSSLNNQSEKRPICPPLCLRDERCPPCPPRQESASQGLHQTSCPPSRCFSTPTAGCLLCKYTPCAGPYPRWGLKTSGRLFLFLFFFFFRLFFLC